MSKEIFLYSEDNKYKCGIELAESTDRFGFPDHSIIVLFEEREDGTYIIAEARDMLLETQKDQQIAELQKQLEEKEKIIQMQQNIERYDIGEMLTENTKLRQQLKSQPVEIVEKIKKGIKDNMICFWKDEDQKSFNRILKSILKLKK